MLAQWLSPVLAWLGVDLLTLCLLVIIILLIIRLVKGD